VSRHKRGWREGFDRDSAPARPGRCRRPPRTAPRYACVRSRRAFASAQLGLKEPLAGAGGSRDLPWDFLRHGQTAPAPCKKPVCVRSRGRRDELSAEFGRVMLGSAQRTGLEPRFDAGWKMFPGPFEEVVSGQWRTGGSSGSTLGLHPCRLGSSAATAAAPNPRNRAASRDPARPVATLGQHS
jgi:hypothetical protein